MKIKNISNDSLKLSINSLSVGNIILDLKPKQVAFLERETHTNKQLLIYEKKKLISIFNDAEKSNNISYYKPFYESVSEYESTNDNKPKGFLVELVEEDEIESVPVDSVETIDFDTDMNVDLDGFEPDEISPKRGRGRPAGTKKIKLETDPSQPKRGRGRPAGTKKIKLEIDPNEPKKGRGRPAGTKKIKLEIDPNQPKKGRGRPAGSLNKKTLNLNEQENTKSHLKKKVGRPKKISTLSY